MKSKLMRTVSLFLSLACLMFAIPFSAFAAAQETTDGYYKVRYDQDAGGAVITGYTDTTAEEITIPSKLKVGASELSVVGIENYAFGACDNLHTIYIPNNQNLSNFQYKTYGEGVNAAFLTGASLNAYFEKEIGKNYTIDDVSEYIAKAMYERGGRRVNDNDIAYIKEQISVKQALIQDQLNAAPTNSAKLITFFKNIFTADNKLDLSHGTYGVLDLFPEWISTVPYDDLTIRGIDGTAAQDYVKGLERFPGGIRYAITYPYDVSSLDDSVLYYSPVVDDSGAVSTNTCEIVGYTGTATALTIPSTITNSSNGKKYTVKGIIDGAFRNGQRLSSVNIPNSLTDIAQWTYDKKLKNIDKSENCMLGWLDKETQIPGFTVQGYKKDSTNSTTAAYQYAKNSNFPENFNFEDLSEAPSLSKTSIQLRVTAALRNPKQEINLSNYDGDVDWASKDPTIATVTVDSKNQYKATITAQSDGETIVYVILDNGKMFKCEVTVTGTPTEKVTTKATSVTTTGEVESITHRDTVATKLSTDPIEEPIHIVTTTTTVSQQGVITPIHKETTTTTINGGPIIDPPVHSTTTVTTWVTDKPVDTQTSPTESSTTTVTTIATEISSDVSSEETSETSQSSVTTETSETSETSGTTVTTVSSEDVVSSRSETTTSTSVTSPTQPPVLTSIIYYTSIITDKQSDVIATSIIYITSLVTNSSVNTAATSTSTTVNTSSSSDSSQTTADSDKHWFSPSELKTIASILHIPDDVEAEYKQGTAYFSEDSGTWWRYVTVKVGEDVVAYGAFNIPNNKICTDIEVYTGKKITTAATTAASATSTTTTTTTTTSSTTTTDSSSSASTSITTDTDIVTTSVVVVTKTVYLGDANSDGKVNVRDSAYIARMLANSMDDSLPTYSDFNQDGKVNVRDAAAISRALATNTDIQWTKIFIVVKQEDADKRSFTPEELKRINAVLQVPEELPVTYEQDAPYFSDETANWWREVKVKYRGEVIASGKFNIEDCSNYDKDSLSLYDFKYSS